MYNLTLGDKLHQMLKDFYCFGKHCSYHLQVECVLGVLLALYRSGSRVKWDVKDMIGRTDE